MSVYNLPAHGNSKLPGAPAAGQFAEVDLEWLATDLSAGDAAVSRDDIRSVPDAWAQMLLAGAALAGRYPDLQSAIRAEWRALIATIALAGEYSDIYRLSLLPLQGGPGGLSGLLLDPALIPSSTVADGLSWRSSTRVIRLARVKNGAPQAGTAIAMAVPDIIVAPGRGFEKLRVSGAPWLAEGPVDPVSCGLSADRLAMIRHFALCLRSALELLTATGVNGATRKSLVDELQALADACEPLLAGALQVRTGQANGLQWPEPLASALARPPELASGGGESDCRLRLRELATPFKFIILADPTLATTLKRPAETIRLFGRYMLSDIADGRLAQIRSEAAMAGHLILGVEDLLTTRLARLGDRSSLPANAAGARDMLLPITPAMLLVATGRKLADAAILRDDGNQATAGVRLTLANGTSHELVRAYAAGEVRQVERLNDFGIWPDFDSPVWRHYAVRALSNPAAELCLAVPASGPLIAADIAARASDPTQKLIRIDDWARGLVLEPAAGEQRLGGDDAKLVHFTTDAEDGKLGVQSWSTKPVEGFFMTFNGEAVGCIVPMLKPAQQPDEAFEAIVAIDFGTSNTIARIKSGGTDRFAKLEATVLQPIDPPPGQPSFGPTVRSGFADFLPISAQPMPFPTMMKARTLPFAVDPDVPGAQESIYFANADAVEAETARLLDWIGNDPTRIISEIKWDKSEVGIRRTRRFLTLLVLMIGAELTEQGVPINRIKWRLSYPNAFDENQRKEFPAAVRASVGTIISGEGGGGQRDDLAIAFHSEGAAAMQALVVGSRVGSAGALVVMIDIGGGTSDVAIWQGTRTLWEGSFRLAAREFFTDLLVRYPGILKSTGAIDARGVERLVEWTKGKEPQPRKARNLVELALGRANFNDDFGRALIDRIYNPEWLALEEAASVALGGMLWYVGRVIAIRSAEWGLSKVDLGCPTIALVGRGSSYFKHLDPHADARLPKLARMLTTAMGTPEATPEIYFSPTPKQEVVDGLLALDNQISSPLQRGEGAVIGEQIEINGKVLPPETELARLPTPETAPTIDISEMRSFLHALKIETGIDVDLTKKIDNVSRQNAVMSAIRDPFNKREPVTSPLFILGLRGLVGELAK
jgi:hypothetical protein